MILNAKGEKEDRKRVLELGADDYVTTPFSSKEVAIRVKNMHKRKYIININYELNSPIFSIRALSEVLEDGMTEEEEIRQWCC